MTLPLPWTDRWELTEPGPAQRRTIGALATDVIRFAEALDRVLPMCEERQQAFLKLDECQMWARRALEREGG